MYNLKKLETILSENEWTYDSNRDVYVFPQLDRFICTDILQARAGRPVSSIHAEKWPKEFMEEIVSETIYRIKLKDLHIALMMTDYKISEMGLTLIFKEQEFFYPSSLLPKFGESIEVRKNEQGNLEEVETRAIVHSLLIEEVTSSTKDQNLAKIWANLERMFMR